VTLAHNTDPPFGYDVSKSATIQVAAVSGTLNGVGNLARPCREDVYKLCSALAESWAFNPDFTQWTFTIRDGVKWHDGTAFTAEDAKFWIELNAFGAKSGEKNRAPLYYKDRFGSVERVEVLQGNKVRLSFKLPEPHLLNMLGADPALQIAHPRHLMQPLIEKGEVNVTPQDIGWISLGPFKMLRAEKGTSIQVVRNDLYWEKDGKGRKLPYLDGVTFAVIRDPTAMDAALRTGRIDGGARFPGFTLSKERQAQYVKELGDQVWFASVKTWRSNFDMNAIQGPFTDVRLRRAIALWLDKQAAIDSVLGGFGYQYTILAPDNPFVNPDFKTWPGFNPATREADRAEAKRLMAQAGYPNGGIEFTMPCRDNEMDRCEFIIGQLAGLGIKVTGQPLDFAKWSNSTAGHYVAAYDRGAGTVPVHFIPETLEPELARYSANPSVTRVRHEDKKIDDFFARLRSASLDLQQRVKIYREMERYVLLEQAYQTPLLGELSVVPYRSYLKGTLVGAENLINGTDLATVWLDK
jgi:peptide/nickel transport system substrate-binding protein